MSFGSFIRGIAAQVNPFDNGKTYGTFNPPAKKKPEDQYQQQNPNAPQVVQPGASSDPSNLTVQRPDNLFANLNQHLVVTPHPAPNPAVDVTNTPQNQPTLLPHPGTVIQPQRTTQNGQDGNIVNNHFIPDAPKAPDHSFWGHVTSGFKTAGETAVGTVANVPEAALAAARAGTGIVQGVTQLPHLVTAGAATGTQALQEHMNNPLTRQLNRGFQDLNTGAKDVGNFVDKPIGSLNRGLDFAASSYGDHMPMAAGGENVYKREQIPLNALAILATLGGGAAPEASANAGRISQLGNRIMGALNKPLTSNPENIISRAGQSVTSNTAPVVNALNAPISSVRAGLSKLMNSRNVYTAERGAVDAGETANVLSNPQLDELVAPSTQIPVTQQSGSVPIPVNTPRPGPIIREVGGDAPNVRQVPTAEEAAAQQAATKFLDQPSARPDQRIEGVTPRTPEKPFSLDPQTAANSQDKIVSDYADMLRSMGEGNGTQLVPNGEGGYTRTSNNFRTAENKGKSMTKADWRAQAEADLRSGKAEPGHQKAFDDAHNPEVQALLARGERPSTPEGRPITVKQATGINVIDKTEVPQNLPEAPGTVRVTTQTSPNNVKSEAVANAPVVAPPASLPKEVQAALDNPRQFSKRQVDAARNQRNLAKKYAKAQTEKQAAIDSLPESAPKPEGNKGFVQTDELAKGRHGVIQKVHATTEEAQGAHDAANLSTSDVLSQADKEKLDHASVTEQTARNLKAKIQDPSVPKNTPEGKALLTEYHDALTRHAQALAIADKVVRRESTGEQIANRFKNKLIVMSEDASKITDAHMAKIDQAETAFADARDSANKLADKFKASGSEEDFNAWKSAFERQQAADKASRTAEYTVTKDVMKGDSSPVALKAIQDAEKDMGAYSMDHVDASLLSGTGTMVRNKINVMLPRLENKLFGKGSSYAVRKLAPVGGSSSEGAKLGSEVGKTAFKADMVARKEAGVGFIRRTVTAGNTIGEKDIQATAYARGFDHYKQTLSKEGYTGQELTNRAKFNTLTDPDGVIKGAEGYEAQTLKANALSSLTHSKKIENWLSDTVQKKLADGGFGYTGQNVGREVAKAGTRIGIGFPTIIAKSLLEGAKRVSLGIPEAGMAKISYMKTGDKEAYAQHLATAIQHAGSGGSIMTLGYGLGKLGAVSGAYPSDPAERARWKAEGREANSIKIGGQWFGIPGYLGGFALPMMVGAGLAQGNVKDEATIKNIYQSALAASPVDNIQSTLDILTGKASDSKIQSMIASVARTATPAGAFVAEVAKLLDPTKNDTSTKSAVMNIVDKIASGIPGVNNKVNTIPATDDYGNTLHNPNKAAIVFGAQGSEQQQGAGDVQKAQQATDDSYKQLNDYGVLKDKTLMSLVDKKIQAQIGRNQKLTPEQLKKVQESVAKGVSEKGEDTAYLEKEQYDTNLAALKVKRDLLSGDPTVKPSSLKDLDTAIKRGGVYKDNKIPYETISAYEKTSAAEWRKMGLPPGDKNYDPDSYDPEMYQKLWDMDQLMTKNGVSYRKDHLDKNKYTKEDAQGKKEGSGTRQLDSSFGTLKDNNYAPQVQQYATIDAKSGSIPHIAISRPNIVHRISVSGGI